jgi:hypothetical protein
MTRIRMSKQRGQLYLIKQGEGGLQGGEMLTWNGGVYTTVIFRNLQRNLFFNHVGKYRLPTTTF